jgi:hypothetical protein
MQKTLLISLSKRDKGCGVLSACETEKVAPPLKRGDTGGFLLRRGPVLQSDL